MSTKVKSIACPCKTTLSKASVKPNGMGSTKQTYRKERSFATNYIIFFEKLI